MKKEEVFSVVPSVLIIVAIFVVVASARIRESPKPEAQIITPPAVSMVQPGFQDEVQIKLTSSGFVPGEVQHAAGTFAIAVENATLSGEYTLQLKAEDGTVLKEVTVQKGSSAWSVTLQAGQYTLTETHNPWICRINVQ
jgi:2-methylaconitate cis-trans-isomerase PrpF